MSWKGCGWDIIMAFHPSPYGWAAVLPRRAGVLPPGWGVGAEVSSTGFLLHQPESVSICPLLLGPLPPAAPLLQPTLPSLQVHFQGVRGQLSPHMCSLGTNLIPSSSALSTEPPIEGTAQRPSAESITKLGRSTGLGVQKPHFQPQLVLEQVEDPG